MMLDRTDTKNNKSSSPRTGAMSGLASCIAVFAIVILTGMGNTNLAVASTGADSGTVQASSLDSAWTTGLLRWLRLWSENLGCGMPREDLPAQWLADFNACWSTQGLPPNLSRTQRDEMLSTLEGLEAHLLSEPTAIEADLVGQTMHTITSAREKLLGINPVSSPVSVLPNTAGASLRGDR